MQKLVVLVIILISASVMRAQSPAQTPVPQPEAKKAFEKLRSFSGEWSGSIMGIPMAFTIRPASSSTSILYEGHTEKGGPPDHEITMFYIDGNRFLGTHYCDAGNRTQLEGKMAADGNKIEFSFLEVQGSTRGGYLKSWTFHFVDPSRHTVEAVFVTPDGKPITFRGEFQRINPNLKTGKPPL